LRWRAFLGPIVARVTSMSPIAWGYLIVTGLLVVLALPAEIRRRSAARRTVATEETLAAQ
jgi:hypothetical protein